MYCNICQKRVLAHSYHLTCVSCEGVVHLNCLPKITRDDAIYTQRQLNQFYCTLCLNVILPYNHLDDEAFFKAISEMQFKQTAVSFQILQNEELIFSPFDFNEKSDTPLHDIDPDINFYSDKYSLHSCDYYLEGTFNDRILQNNVEDDNFSMLHANILSAQKNLASLEQSINIWNTVFLPLVYQNPGLKNTMLIDMVLKVMMVFTHSDRFALAEECLYLCRTLSSILCEKISHMETIFIEINKEKIRKDKNVIIGVIYRPPDRDIKVFNEYVSELLDKIRSENKCVACLGDYNISLLNSDCHGPTQEFADLMYSYSLFPCITKPTRVTSKTASLIDNIFFNDIVDNLDVFTGILYTDISDHFPIFYIDKATDNKNPPKYLKKRIYSQESLGLFSDLLQNNEWSDVLSSNNPQDAFQMFSDCYRDAYDKCFPFRTIKCGYKTRKPWLSEGLKRSI